MAHALGGLLDLPHGMCNAILLPHVIEANFHYAEEQYVKIFDVLKMNVSQLSSSDRKKLLIERIKTLSIEAGVKETLSDLKVNDDDLDSLSRNAYQDACLITNPRDLSVNELKEIFNSAR
jgi:alcohol dehydrogenase